MSNIKNNNYRKIDCRLYYDSYMDFMLSKDNVNEGVDLNDCIAADLNFSNIKNNFVVSNVAWKESVPSTTILHNIGFTGVDNGFLKYERDRISNDEFLEIFTRSEFKLDTFGDKFFVTQVDGNSNLFSYDIEKNEDYVSLKGGFYQGFFKIDGDKYQTLPHRIENEWNFNINLRKCPYKTNSNILNKRHNNNEGIFLYIGTRAENKFWELYKKNENTNNLKYDNSDDYYADYSVMDNSVIKHQYHEEGYTEETKPCDECLVSYFASDDYLKEQLLLNDIKITDSKNNAIGEKGFYEIETNNKFIIFNRTKDGFTKNNWKDEYTYIITGKKDSPNINYYPYLNHTKNGYDKNNIDKLIEEHSYAYNIFKDIDCNALGFKINGDGSIGYRFLSENCELIEETSKPNLIKENEWVNIHIKIIRKNAELPNDCEKHYKQGKMQIYIYVNGYLKLVSKELPEILLKRIDDTSERQEGVPYSLSIGGGTQGLSERIFLDYYDRTDYLLPIEENFAGSFIGDIKNFKFFHGRIRFSGISKIIK